MKYFTSNMQTKNKQTKKGTSGLNAALFTGIYVRLDAAGTSLSAPQISGMIANLWNQFTFLNQSQIINILKDTKNSLTNINFCPENTNCILPLFQCLGQYATNSPTLNPTTTLKPTTKQPTTKQPTTVQPTTTTTAPTAKR